MRERIKEIVDFARSESPYKNANKGWLNDDVYIRWGGLAEDTPKESKELVNVFLFWEPIQKLISLIFIVIAISSIFVVTSVSFAKGRFDLSAILTSEIFQIKESISNNQIEIMNTDPIEIKVDLDDSQNVSEIVSSQIDEIEPKSETSSEGNMLQPKTTISSGNMLAPKAK